MDRSVNGSTYQCVVNMPDPTPLAIGRHDLESRHRLTPENRDCTDVWGTREYNQHEHQIEYVNLACMSFKPYVLRLFFLFFCPRVAERGYVTTETNVQKSGTYYFKNRAGRKFV